ncbi:hypothetical protein D3C87_1527890 [compost metagenome]
MEEICEFMEQEKSSDQRPYGFYFFEKTKAERTLELMRSPLPPEKLSAMRKNFHSFFSEHDHRRQTDFVGTFPEMQEFWELCKNA